MKAFLLYLVPLVLSLQQQALAQKMKKQYKYWTVGWNINAMNYVGEVDPGAGILSPGIKFTRQNLGVFIGKRLNPHLTFRYNLSHGVIGGSDAENASMSDRDIYRKIRNLSFRSSIMEVKADVVYDIFKNWGKPEKRVDYTPYFFAGIAYFHHNPKAKAPDDMGGQWVELRPLNLEGKKYSLHQISIPAGIGFRYKLGQRWDLAFEMGWRFTFTDYLDGISGSYRGRESFGDNQLAIAMYD
ncbi:MAG: hypothetical protein K2X86_05160, partial [Cytophagaceae bacterium]|nr:hypothetical protein [Cytophagaceae bacterium]